MTTEKHEFRDPIHTFIGASDEERQIIDSEPVQRLRHIHQLAMSYLVYPGATHRRFEHSLGVMELAGRIYDVVTSPGKLGESPQVVQAWFSSSDRIGYWRRIVRFAALCHDIGHLPFSHAAEKDLLPSRWNHERLTIEHIQSSAMQATWRVLQPPVLVDDIVKLAVGAKHFADPKDSLSLQQTVLSEIITGDGFGADRMDYLLRDSLHAGVAYGRFDHYRLIDTLRILAMPDAETGEETDELQLGVEVGGLESAEALAMARYFMYAQVYFHRTRRIFDIHLKDFLKDYLDAGVFSVDPAVHLAVTDAEITSALRAAARNSSLAGHEAARRIVDRTPFKLLWERTPGDLQKNLDAGTAIEQAAIEKFGKDSIRRDEYNQKSVSFDFPVLERNGTVTRASVRSSVIKNLPTIAVDFIFVRPELEAQAEVWLKENKSVILDQQIAKKLEE